MAGSTTIISQGGAEGSGTGTAKLTEDVVQVLSQLTPIMDQLAGVDLKSFLQDISKLPVLTHLMLERGWPEEDIRAVLGLNIRRLLAEPGDQ